MALKLSTILLAFTSVLILVSATLMVYVIYQLTSAGDTDKVEDYWKTKKLFVISPTVLNVMSLAVMGAYFAFL